jgi:hypothetical protein
MKGKKQIKKPSTSVPEKLTIIFLVCFTIALFIKVMFY